MGTYNLFLLNSRFKCVKCNGLHKVKYHQNFAWYCKANSKTNPPYLEIKQEEFCSYSFKCLNYKGDHQANSNMCSFWKHYFNKEWHTKKYQKFLKTKKQSIHSAMSIIQAYLLEVSKYSCKMFERTKFSPI